MALGEGGERRLLERLGDLNPRGAKLSRGLPQQTRARVLGAVDAMAEAHDALAPLEGVAYPFLRIARLCDRVEHRQHARRRAAVQWARERTDRGGERGAAVRRGRRNDPRRE